MKLSLLGTAGCLDARCERSLASGGYRVVTAKRIRETIDEQELLRFGGRRRVGDIFVLDCRSGCSRSL